MTPSDGASASGITAAGSYGAGPANTNGSFSLKGGRYSMTVVASTFGTNITLQQLGPDSSTWVPAPAAIGTNPLTAAGTVLFDLPGGQFRFLTTGTFVAGAAAIYSVRGNG